MDLIALNDSERMDALLSLNDFSQNYGLSLSPCAVQMILQENRRILEETGCIEFEFGTIGKFIECFSDSPYIEQTEYPDLLCDLLRLFYHIKNESGETFSDERIIEQMRCNFDDPCHGSIDLLADMLWGGLK